MKPLDKKGAQPGSKRAEKELTPLTNHIPGTASIRRHTSDATLGEGELCAWRTVPGITWVQTRSPRIARKLSQRLDSRLVMRGVAGGYLRTFELRHGLGWAQRLIARYTQDEKATNARKTAGISPASSFLAPGVSAHRPHGV